MASPQIENGFTRISNELFQALIRADFSKHSPLPLKLVMCVIRKTYGYNKKIDRIPLSQFQKMTGSSRSNVNHWLKALVSMLVLVTELKPEGRYYGLNKDYTQWLVPTLELVPARAFTSTTPRTTASTTPNTSASTTPRTLKRNSLKKRERKQKTTPPTPKELGTNPRASGENPRSTGTSPRAVGQDPRSLGDPQPARGGENFSDREREPRPSAKPRDRRIDYVMSREDYDEQTWDYTLEFVRLQPDTSNSLFRATDLVKRYGFAALAYCFREPHCTSMGKLDQFASYYQKNCGEYDPDQE